VSKIKEGLLVYTLAEEEIMAYQKDGRFEDWSDMDDPSDSWEEWQGDTATCVVGEMRFDSFILPEEYLK